MYSSDGAFAVIACVSKGALLEESAYRKILADKPHLPRPQRPLVLV
jgi:hypothetical protein